MLIRTALVVSSLMLAATRPVLARDGGREIDFPKSEPFVTADGAIAVVGYNDMREILESVGAIFTAAHPEIRFAFDLRGTRFAPAALAAGSSAFAPMGGEFTPAQLAAYRAAVGEQPLVFRVAHASASPRALSGVLGIFVHRDNPLTSLSLAQAARAFAGRVVQWGDLGATGWWAARSIHLYGVNPDAVLGIVAHNHLLGGRSFSRRFVGFPQSVDVIERVSVDVIGLGFSAANRGTPAVRALALAATEKDKPLAPTAENIASGKYPLDRFLLIYARRPLIQLTREFLRLMLSPPGQSAVAASPQQYIPLSPPELAAERAKLD